MPIEFLSETLLPSLIAGLVTAAWPERWSARPRYPSEHEAPGQAQTAVLVAIIILGLVFALLARMPTVYAAPTDSRSYELIDVVGQALAWALVLIPMHLGASHHQLKLADLQLHGRRWLSAIALSVVIGAIFFVAQGKVDAAPRLWAWWGLYAALQYLVVGLAEEVFARGYLQVRWVAAAGWWVGWLGASLVMAALHLPQYLIAYQMEWLPAIVEVAQILPLSLLLGYVLHKNGNLLAPILVHLWFNLASAL